ncbi:MAG: hypothetical protein D6753_04460 [Planctomycetota bacterium]|nr:MAG: hypothetical protein D6753_04460 [Planctomycetota bacterium]
MSNLTDNEIKILRVFRKYLMSPGQVLCLSNTDVGSKKAGLQEMIADGLLVAESVRDGYSLTRRGYRAMLRLDS